MRTNAIETSPQWRYQLLPLNKTTSGLLA